jgi:hypothetical protein
VANFTLGNNDYHPVTDSGWYQENGEGDGIEIVGFDSVGNNIFNNTIIDCPIRGINLRPFAFNTTIEGNTIINCNTAVSVLTAYNLIANNTFVNTQRGVAFDGHNLISGNNTWVLNETNTVYGNQNLSSVYLPSPFPSTTPSPTPYHAITPAPTPTTIFTISPTPNSTPTSSSTPSESAVQSPSVPEFPFIVAALVLMSSVIVTSIAYKKRQKEIKR